MYVVTKDEFTPQSFREKSTLTKKVSKAIRDLRSQIAIDLIVHTKSMHKNFKELNSSFMNPKLALAWLKAAYGDILVLEKIKNDELITHFVNQIFQEVRSLLSIDLKELTS